MEDYERFAKVFREAQREAEAEGYTLDQTSLGEALDPKVTQTAISKWLAGKPHGGMEIPFERVIEIAEVLGVDVSVLSPMVAAKVEAAAQNLPLASKLAFRRVKVLEGESVLDLIKAITKGKAPAITEFRHCPQRHSDSTYALKATGEAMSPMIPAHSWVYVDTEAPGEIGKPVCALRGSEVIFATYKGDGYLEYANTEYPERVFKMGKQDTIVGKVIQIDITF